MPDIQRILIEIAADVQELTPAIDQLERLGEIDKKSADAFKKTNAEITNRTKALSGVTTEQSKVTESTKQTAQAYEKLSNGLSNASKNILSGASSELIQGFAEGVNDALKEAGVTAEQFEAKLKDAFENGAKDAPAATEKVVSLKTQLRQMKEELATLDPNSARFKELSEEAGQLQDKIGDVALEVRNLASDTRNIDGVVQGVQGLAGAFQLAEGSAALFGQESEDIQKTLVKLTALMNISNGLQQVGNLLQRQSAAMLLVTNFQTKLSITYKTLEGAAESKNIIIRNLATAAQWALNAAMSANPAGLLITSLAALAAAVVYFTGETESAAEAQTKLNESQLEGLKTTFAIDDAINKQLDRQTQKLEDELTLMRARGATSVELAKKELEIANARALAAKQSEAFLAKDLQGVQNLTAEEQKLRIALDAAREAKSDPEAIKQLESELALVQLRLNKEEELAKKRREALLGQKTAGANLEKAQAEEAKKAQEELQKKREEAAKKFRELELQALEDKKAVIQAELLAVEDGTKEQEDLRLALVQAQAQIDLFSLEGTKNTEAQRNLIVAEATEQEKKIRLDAAKATQDAIFEQQNKIGGADVNIIQAELAQAEEGSRAQLEIKNSLLEAQADLEKLAAQEKFANSKKSAEDEKLFASEILNIDANTNFQKSQNSQEYFDNQEKLRQEELEATKAQQAEIVDILKQGAFQVVDEIVAYQTQARQREIQNSLDERLEGINKEREAELKNKNLTAAQKEKIEEKYRKKEAEAKLAAWKEDQQARSSAAAMAMALAIINTLASVPYPGNIAAAAIVAALGYAQIDAIESEDPPSFFKGTESLELNGNPKGRDTIPVMAHEGERIVPTENNNKYYESYSILQNEKVTPQFAKAALTGEMPSFKMIEFTPAMVEQSSKSFNYTTTDIDYKKLGASMSTDLIDEMERNTEEVSKVFGGILEIAENIKSTNSSPRPHAR